VEDAAAASAREISEAVFSHDELRDLPSILTPSSTKPRSRRQAENYRSPRYPAASLAQTGRPERNDVTLVCALFDSNGNYLKGTEKVVELRLKDENVEHHVTRLTMNTDFDVKSGAYMIRVVARDAEGQQMATATTPWRFHENSADAAVCLPHGVRAVLLVLGSPLLAQTGGSGGEPRPA